ncbi:MAG: transcription termination/antitermination protein NusG [Candidatus Chromulinivorax sp.]
MKRWYVLQIYAGYEEQVKADLERRIKENNHEDRLGAVLVPTAKMKQLFGAAEEKDQQLFPGYVLVEMEMSAELARFVLATPRVLRFLGGKDPMALSNKEVDRVLEKIRGGVVLAADKDDFVVDSEVTIEDGPFTGFVGFIEKVDSEAQKLIVKVSIFGRMTPVELRFDQVKK